ncbi:HNH endonuclease [Paraburkholderia sp. EG287A]|uniref:homing endonuclease associated repeat-containing protein n=1 Tax=Paraburkholderia sp. EG287A TaxID=3237012 RepID=UPI0034D2ED2A
MASKYTKDGLIAALRYQYELTGSVPTYSSIVAVVPSHTVWARHFGCWNNALRAAGLPVCKNNDPLPDRACGHCKVALAKNAARSKRYCSKSCANKARSTGKTKPRSGLTKEEFLLQARERKLAALLAADFASLSPESRRKRVIHEQAGACKRCTLSEWMGEKLTLEVDHKDGNPDNNRRENLEGLCPNCHSLTPTWRGRNIAGRKQMDTLNVEALRASLSEGKSLSQALRDQGRCGKGATHARAKALLAA